MSLRRLTLALALLLAACGTPMERCMSGFMREMGVVDRLIAETEANLARGYALEDSTEFGTILGACSPPVYVRLPDGSTIVNPGQQCLQTISYPVERPVAIDPVTERNKLAGLQQRQKALMKEMDPAIAQCRLLHPE